MILTKDPHKQFAHYFGSKTLEPYLYLLSKKLNEGHICIDLAQINQSELADAGYDELAHIEDLKSADLVAVNQTDEPFVYFNDRLYLQRYFKYENSVFSRIKNLIESGRERIEQQKTILLDISNHVNEMFPDQSNQTNWQMIAALSAVLNRFSIITGGPGTGKTTTVAKVLTLLYRLSPNLKVALAAPTGKAAARMAESLKNARDLSEGMKSIINKLEPLTIHRLLGYQKNSLYFKHHADHHLNYDVIIIDESSMIDIALFSKLLEAISSDTKLILLGDKDQLASVEAGSLFSDLCMAQEKLNHFSQERIEFFNRFGANLNPDEAVESHHLLFQHIVELQVSHRFKDDGGIGKLSKAIIQNRTESILSFYEHQDEQVRMDETYSDAILDEIAEAYRAYIEATDIADALQKLNQVRVLCATREGEDGIYRMNEKIQQKLKEKSLIQLDSEFYNHRPVMVLSNNYDLGLFNGDIGIVREERRGDEIVKRVWFEGNDGELKSVLSSFLDSVETVFAMTIHKSQGSEFNRVLVVLPRMEELALLTRELLYTAVTRAKDEVIVQGSKEAVLSCAEKRVERGSGIVERFKVRN